MKNVIMAAILLLAFISARAQESHESYAALKDDYNEATLVARVRVSKVKVLGDMGAGYFEYEYYCRVIEPFKGRIRKGTYIQYGMMADDGSDHLRDLGDKIVFLQGNYDAHSKKWGFTVVMNTTRRYSSATLGKMRRIGSGRKHSYR